MEIQRFWWLERLSVGMVVKRDPWLWKALGYVLLELLRETFRAFRAFSCVLVRCSSEPKDSISDQKIYKIH